MYKSDFGLYDLQNLSVNAKRMGKQDACIDMLLRWAETTSKLLASQQKQIKELKEKLRKASPYEQR